MRDDFVEQQQRHDAGHFGNQRGMGQHQPDQKRLLLAGGGVARRHVFGRVDHLQIGEMGTIQRAAGRGVAGAAGAQDLAIAILDSGRGLVDQRILHPAIEHDLCRRKGGSLPAFAQHRRQPRHGLAAGGGDRYRKLGGFALDRVAPMVVIVAHFEQAVARAQRALQRRDAAGMFAVDRQHQPVEEAPPFGSCAEKQPVHGGRQPHHAQVIAKGGCRTHRLAVDPAAPAG